jgi:hypothetical protein
MPLEGGGSWELADGGSVSGEDGGWTPPSLCFGETGAEDGVCGSLAIGFDGAKPIRNGGCSPGDFGGSIAGDGFSFSGKFGNAGVATLAGGGETADGPDNSAVVGFCFPSGSRGRSPHRLDLAADSPP